MAGPLFTNNGVSALAAPIGPGDLAVSLLPGDGANFPSPSGGNWVPLVVESGAPTAPPDERTREIIYGMTRVGDVFTSVVRAQEGTAEGTWAAGAFIENRETAGSIAALAGVAVAAATAAVLGTVKISGTPTDPANPTTYVKEQSDTLLAGKAASIHTHAQADITNLVADLAAIVSSLGGKATPADISAAIAALVASSPATLDTLNELALALGSDPNFATTIAAAIAAKQTGDAGLTALAALGATAGLIEKTALDTYVERLIGVGAGTSIPSRADADARYAAQQPVSSFSFDGTDYWTLPGVVTINLNAPVYNTGGADRSLYQHVWFDRAATITAFGMEVTTLAAASTLTCYVYAANEATYQPTGAQLGASAAMDSSTTGMKVSAGHSIAVSRGLYVIQIVNAGGNPSYRVVPGVLVGLTWIRDSFSTTYVVCEPRQIGTTPGGAFTFISSGGINYSRYGCLLKVT